MQVPFPAKEAALAESYTSPFMGLCRYFVYEVKFISFVKCMLITTTTTMYVGRLHTMELCCAESVLLINSAYGLRTRRKQVCLPVFLTHFLLVDKRLSGAWSPGILSIGWHQDHVRVILYSG